MKTEWSLFQGNFATKARVSSQSVVGTTAKKLFCTFCYRERKKQDAVLCIPKKGKKRRGPTVKPFFPLSSIPNISSTKFRLYANAEEDFCSRPFQDTTEVCHHGFMRQYENVCSGLLDGELPMALKAKTDNRERESLIQY